MEARPSARATKENIAGNEQKMENNIIDIRKYVRAQRDELLKLGDDYFTSSEKEFNEFVGSIHLV